MPTQLELPWKGDPQASASDFYYLTGWNEPAG